MRILNKMKIAIFSDTFPPQVNGVANTVFNSASSLAEKGHIIRVYTVSETCDEELTRKTDGKFSVFKLPSIGIPSYPGERSSLPLGITLGDVRSFSPDIIHVHTPFSVGWEGVLCSKKMKIPLIGTHHTFFDHYLKHIHLEYDWAKRLSWKYTVAFYNKCDLIISPTMSLANGLRNNKLKKPIEILSNTVDTDTFQPIAGISKKGKKVAYMGRVSYEKNIDQAIKAISITAKKISDIKFYIIGNGPEKNNLENLSKDLKIQNNVIFTGYLFGNDLNKQLNDCDIFLTPSKSENMPLSVLEAMSAGLPILAVSSLGMNEIIKNNENGFLLPPDDPQKTAEKIIELIYNEEKIKKIGKCSREMAMEYSKSKITDKLVGIYKKTINSKK